MSEESKKETLRARAVRWFVPLGLVAAVGAGAAHEVYDTGEATASYRESVEIAAIRTLEGIANNDSIPGLSVEGGKTLTEHDIVADDMAARRGLRTMFTWQPITVPKGSRPSEVISKEGWGMLDLEGRRATVEDAAMKVLVVYRNNPEGVDPGTARGLLDRFVRTNQAYGDSAQEEVAQLSQAVNGLVDDLIDNGQVYLPASVDKSGQ